MSERPQMKWIEKFAIVSAGVMVAGGGYLITQNVAHADTENCVSQSEYDRLQTFMSTDEVRNLFDVGGYFLSSNDNVFRRAYRTCAWAGNQEVVVAYSNQTGLSSHWSVREVG
jgi:hypothetical protein